MMKYLLIIFGICLSLVSFSNEEISLGPDPCDTIKLVDGRIIVAKVFYEDRTIVKYSNCNENIKTKDQIEAYKVKEIIYGSDQHEQPFVEDKSRLNRNGIYWIIGLAALLLGVTIATIFLLK